MATRSNYKYYKNCIEHNENNGTIYINYEENSLFTKITIRDEGEGIPKRRFETYI